MDEAPEQDANTGVLHFVQDDDLRGGISAAGAEEVGEECAALVGEEAGDDFDFVVELAGGS